MWTALGLVHRDLKPANIFMAGEDGGTVKILDFGIAKETRKQRIESDEPTSRGQLLGSPRYMSPEQVRGLDVDDRSDLWSLATVLYQSLVGRHAFDGRSVPDVLRSIWEDHPPAPSSFRPELGEAVDAFFARAFAKSPEARWPDAETFVYAFHAALAATPPSSESHPTVPRPAATIQPPGPPPGPHAGPHRTQVA